MQQSLCLNDALISNRHPDPAESPTGSWQSAFLNLFPKITALARQAFRSFLPEARQEAIQEVVINSMIAFKKLFECGRHAVARSGALVRYALRQFYDGRRVGCSINSRDVSSVACQKQRGVRCINLNHFDRQNLCWKELLVEDQSCCPADLAASRIDFADWMQTLTLRKRHIAEVLAEGTSTNETVRMFKVTAARVSQLRRELQSSWEQFQGHPLPV